MLNRKVLFFISVVETGSFSAAAKKFYLSQSAISQQIIQLEEELGVQLLDRSKYRPVLTKAGSYYYEECKKLIDNYEAILQTTKELGIKDHKILNIGITGPMEKKHLPFIILEYKKQYPEVYIDVKKITFENGVNLIENGTLDVAFGITNDYKGKPNIITINLLKHKICAICSKNHPWAGKNSIDGREIDGQPIISLSKKLGNNFYTDFLDSFKKDGIVPNIIKQVDELEELLLAVKINQGIALVSREVITPDDDVCVLDIENTHHHADFCLGYWSKNNKEYLKPFTQEALRYFTNLEL